MKYEPANQFKGYSGSNRQQVSVFMLRNGPLGSPRGPSLVIIFINEFLVCCEDITYLAYSLVASHCVGRWV